MQSKSSSIKVVERRVNDMLSIDEAITKYKEITNTDAVCPAHCNIPCDRCLQESEQLVEWLEELKEIKSNGRYVQGNKAGQKIGYRNAIDDLSNKICMHFADWKYSEDDKCIKDIIEFASESVEEIAERLKAVDTNE